MQSEALARLMTFILTLNASVRNLKLSDASSTRSSSIQTLCRLLQSVHAMVDACPPVDEESGNNRYGNRAFRTLIQSLESETPTLLRQHLPSEHHWAVPELSAYFSASFGHAMRIDYGSGHELNFVAFLCCLWLIGMLDGDRKATMYYHILLSSAGASEVSNAQDIPEAACKELRDVVLVVFHEYLILVRRLQREYRLEPAGSHGVWGLDDFQFLVYMFGSAQLMDHKHLKPRSFVNREIVHTYAKDYLFLEAIQFIHEMKRGPFHEHSPMLYDISGVPNWVKVNGGLIKMFDAEVLRKFPIVQHFLFGYLLPFKPAATYDQTDQQVVGNEKTNQQ